MKKCFKSYLKNKIMEFQEPPCSICIQLNQQFPSDATTKATYCHIAAFNDHVRCLQHAHENGCDLDANVCLVSIATGNLNCLKYCHERGGNMLVNSLELAARSVDWNV